MSAHLPTISRPRPEISFAVVSWLGGPPHVPMPKRASRAQLAEARALGGTATFAVTATFMGSGNAPKKHREGELIISPDAIAFIGHDLDEPKRFDHAESDIKMVKGLLCLPWANTFLFLIDSASTVRIAVPMSARRGLRRALRDAGVTVHKQSSSRTPELPRRGGRRT